MNNNDNKNKKIKNNNNYNNDTASNVNKKKNYVICQCYLVILQLFKNQLFNTISANDKILKKYLTI